MTNRNNFIRIAFFLPLPLISGLIFYLSGLSKVPIPDLGILQQDKFLHMIAFFFYGYSALLFLEALKPEPGRKTTILFFLIVIIFSASDEFHQYYIPGRTCDFYDWIADLIGFSTSYFTRNSLLNFANKLSKKIFS